MATWEDGPEYAPMERPAEFSTPAAAPLEVVPPAEQLAAQAPAERPVFDAPQAPVAPLATLVPVQSDERNPAVPFDVASSTVTSMDSAWGAAHWSPPGGPASPAAVPPSSRPPLPPLAPQDPAASPWPAPPGPAAAWPPPSAPLPPVGGPAQLPSGYPPPGTPQWFGPGPAGQLPPPSPSTSVDARAVSTAATPGLLICLAVGGFFHPFAPIALGVAFFLTQRVQVSRAAVRRAFFIALGFLGLIAVVGLADWISFDDWWGRLAWWALAMCWGLLITVLVLVYRGLKGGPPRPPTTYSNWG